MLHRLLLGLGLFGVALGIGAAPVSRVLAPGVTAQQTTLQAPGANVELRAAAVSWPEQAALLTVAARPDGANRGAGVLQAWTRRIDLRDPNDADWTHAPRADQPLTDLHGARSLGSLLAAEAPRRFALLASDEVGITRLIRLDASAESVVSLDLTNVELRSFVAAPNGRLLIAGATGLQPFAAETDGQGGVLRRWVLADVQGSMLVALPTADGDLLALVDASSPAEPRFAVLRAGADGRVKSRIERNGQAMDMVRLRDGDLALVYGRQQEGRHQARLLTLDAAVKDARADVELTSSATPMPRFRMATAPQGGAVVAGARDRGLWVGRLSASGALVWSSWTDPRQTADLELTLGVDLQASEGRFLLAYSALVAEGRRQFAVVRTLRFDID